MAKKQKFESSQVAQSAVSNGSVPPITKIGDDTLSKVSSDAVTSTIKEVDSPKALINTKKAAEAVAAGASNGTPGAATAFGRRGVVFSGGAGNISGDMSATVEATQPYRSGSRLGRRQDPITRKIDLLTTEIIKEKVDRSKALDETDAKQGYSDLYVNEHAVTQRLNGGAPADPLFMRSADEIDLDIMYYADGQYVSGRNQSTDYMIPDYDTVNRRYSDARVHVERGNHVARYLEFDVSTTGEISNFEITSENFISNDVDERTYRAASDALLRSTNRTALDRAQMTAVAGDENSAGWNPLPLAIPEPDTQNGFLRDFDLSIGDIIYTSYRNLGHALSYQINKTAKDGSRMTGPMAEMCNGLVTTAAANAGVLTSVAEDAGINLTFNTPEILRNGGAGLYVAMNDSLPKYTTKGKLLSLPLSFKSALEAAKANVAPLKMHKQLQDLCVKNDLFSTIDGPYDGVKPIVVTNGKVIATPVPLNVGSENENRTIYTLHYENLRNVYNFAIRNYFMNGLERYVAARGSQIATHMARIGGFQDGNCHFRIPCVSTLTSISLWDLLVCAAVPNIVEERIMTLTVLNDYEEKHGYPYTGHLSLSDANIHGAENFSYSDENTELSSAIAKPIAAMKVIMPEIFWPVSVVSGEASYIDERGLNGHGALTVLPHYFVQNQFEILTDDGADDAIQLGDQGASMAYPSTRSGSTFSYMDTIYGMSEEDYRLSLDRMVNIPGAFNGTKYIGAVENIGGEFHFDPDFAPSAYKYGLYADGQPVIPFYAFDAEHKDACLTISDILSTPRELGLMQVVPAGFITPIPRDDTHTAAHTLESDAGFLSMSGPGFKLKAYRAAVYRPADEDSDASGYLNSVHDTLTAGQLGGAANESLRGVYSVVTAIPLDSDWDNGLALNAAHGTQALNAFTVGSYDGAAFDEEFGVYNNAEVASGLTRNSSMKYTWTRMQRLPFAINPFDANVDAVGDIVGNINETDIFEFLYMLGLCGFLASDYSELQYNRSKQRISQGMNYIYDPYVDKSMLLK